MPGEGDYQTVACDDEESVVSERSMNNSPRQPRRHGQNVGAVDNPLCPVQRWLSYDCRRYTRQPAGIQPATFAGRLSLGLLMGLPLPPSVL